VGRDSIREAAREMKPRTYTITLVLTLVLAADLRFAHLGWGLRQRRVRRAELVR